MADLPWQGDACSLVDAFRAGERSPVEEVLATLAAAQRSGLNAVCHVDEDAALAAAAAADVSDPFGGVPIAVKELEPVAGWPATQASLALADRVADHDATMVCRLRAAGAVLWGQTTASEFGAVNFTATALHGVTRNPWDPSRTPGGSSGGSAAVVAGGICTLASGGDGGGSIRIPAGFCGLVGVKSTYGRIPRGPRALLGSLTVTVGCLARSVRDAARWIDVCEGHHPRDPLSLPALGGWEVGLGTHGESLRGLRAAVLTGFGGTVVAPAVAEAVEEAAEDLVAACGMRRVPAPAVRLPPMGLGWVIAGTPGLVVELGDRWPDAASQLGPEAALGVQFSRLQDGLETRALMETQRVALAEAMADLFDHVDVILAPTNPDVAFAAEGPMPTQVAGVEVEMANNGNLTIPSNLYGNPAVSVPAGLVDGLPVGLQLIGPHHADKLLLDAAWHWERTRPWPLVAPSAPC